VRLVRCIAVVGATAGVLLQASPALPVPAVAPTTWSFGGAVLSATATAAWTASLAWTVPAAAATVRILRDRRLIDEVPAAAAGYTDHLLWPLTAYRYEADALDAQGSIVAWATASATTPAPSVAFPRLYADSSFWNTPIDPRPSLDANSPAMVNASLTPYRSLGQINDDDAWGIPIAYADPDSHRYDVGCTLYNCDPPVSFRIPAYAAPNTGSDGHLAVYDPSDNTELDLWQGIHDPATDTWSASGRTASAADWGAACPEGSRCGGGGTAAGFLEFGGVIRPEEILQGHIDHALAISMPYVRRDFIACPATNYWASQTTQYQDDPNAVPLGAHVQLDPSIDVDARPWPPWEKVVARALQTYGAFVTDVSGTLELRGEATLDRGYDGWALVGMSTAPHPSLRNLPWKRFRVLQVVAC
jgi:hypothetical protein